MIEYINALWIYSLKISQLDTKPSHQMTHLQNCRAALKIVIHAQSMCFTHVCTVQQGCDVSRHVLVSRPSRDLILRSWSWSRSWKKRSWSWSRSWEKRSWSWSRSWDQRSWCLGLETKTKTSNSGCVLMSWKNAKHRLHVLRNSCFMSKGENARRKIQSWLHAQYLSLSWTQLSEITVCTSFIDTAASSAPVERVFQHSGLIMKPHRGRIDESFLEALVYLKCNWYS